jgi:hypothetical protein
MWACQRLVSFPPEIFGRVIDAKTRSDKEGIRGKGGGDRYRLKKQIGVSWNSEIKRLRNIRRPWETVSHIGSQCGTVFSSLLGTFAQNLC